MGIERRLNRDIEITLSDPDADKYKDVESVEPTEELKPTDDLSVTFHGTIENRLPAKERKRILYYFRGEGFGITVANDGTLTRGKVAALMPLKVAKKTLRQIKRDKKLKSMFGERLTLYSVECVEFTDDGSPLAVYDNFAPVKIIHLNKRKRKEVAK